MNNEKELIAKYASKFQGSEDYYMKNTSAVVELSNGYLLGIDKPRIETRFCFHDEGVDYENYKTLCANKETALKVHFFRENLEGLEREIAGIEKEFDSLARIYGAILRTGNYGLGTANVTVYAYNAISDDSFIQEGIEKHEKAPEFYPLRGSDKQKVLEALKKVKADFEKRLNTYWKRYGAEKLHLWTYWADA